MTPFLSGEETKPVRKACVTLGWKLFDWLNGDMREDANQTVARKTCGFAGVLEQIGGLVQSRLWTNSDSS